MKKTRKVKGFTLIECLVAMALLAVTSMLLAQSYTTILKIANKTNKLNYSLNYQTVDAELKNSNRTDVTPTDSSKAKITYKLVGTCDSSDKTTVNKTISSNSLTEYAIDVKVYTVYAYENDSSLSKATVSLSDASDGTDTRYIYFVGD